MISDNSINKKVLNNIVVTCPDFGISDLQISMESLEINLSSIGDISTDTIHSRSSSRRTRFNSIGKNDEGILHQINRRVISKPKKIILNSERDVHKFYLKARITNFKPTCLETIFEEAQSSELETIDSNVKLIGMKKLKRALPFVDFINTPKTTILRRKKRIKTSLKSKSKKIEKISMQYFLERLMKTEDCAAQRSSTTAMCTVVNNTTIVPGSSDTFTESADVDTSTLDQADTLPLQKD